jgi:hypothetical protein
MQTMAFDFAAIAAMQTVIDQILRVGTRLDLTGKSHLTPRIRRRARIPKSFPPFRIALYVATVKGVRNAALALLVIYMHRDELAWNDVILRSLIVLEIHKNIM